MYLHIGNNKTIKMTDIVGIFDTDSATVSKYTKQYLSSSEKRGETVNVTTEIPKSFILVSEKKKSGKPASMSSPTEAFSSEKKSETAKSNLQGFPSDKKNTVYFSQLSGKTLCQRADDILAEIHRSR